MTTTQPTLREWHGLKPPEIRTVGSLDGYIPKDIYSQVYCILMVRPQDNVIIEAQPMKTWHFTTDGRLIGEYDTYIGVSGIVEINLDEYVVLSLK